MRGETMLLGAVKTAGPASGRRAPWLSAAAGIDSGLLAWRWWCRGWSKPKRPGSFSPPTREGPRDRMMISAAWGFGEAIVGGRVTPDRLVMDRTTGRVMAREIADKAVMTVCTEDGTRAARASRAAPGAVLGRGDGRS